MCVCVGIMGEKMNCLFEIITQRMLSSSFVFIIIDDDDTLRG